MAVITRTAEAEIVRRTDTGGGYVDWGAIFAGAVVGTAIALMFFAFGSALGFGLASFAGRGAMPGLGVIMAIGLWLIWLQTTASFGGGYVAGRLRRRINDAPKHEVEMRDGMHGLVVWGLGILLGAAMTALVATVGAMSAATIGAGAASNPQAANMSDYYVDLLVRPGAAAPATDGAGETATTAAGNTAGRTLDQNMRSQFARLLSSGSVTSADSADRSYLIQQIAAQSGLSEQAAAERLDTTLAAMKARADQARRLGVLMAFITVVSLLISAVAGWWAATKGGEHRDDAVDHTRYSSWR